jgi:RHH-type proline utilization regulon transcriptional repressor/proline dehydrogenase/delta 1-pyrroline-5-carboxylate dehydrogenase
VLEALIAGHGPDAALRARVQSRAVRLVDSIRRDSKPTMMALFLAEYGLSTDEGVALLFLAEALPCFWRPNASH